MGKGKNQEVKSYLKLSSDALRASEVLLGNKLFREAVSRAYYSMFYAVSALLCTTGKTSKRHSGVIDLFNQHFVKTKEIDFKFYKKYVKAFEDRLHADYKISTPIIEKIAIQRLEDANEFYEVVTGWLKRKGII